ncbi:MAG: DUF58 domain-containing protein [Bacteroidota bacterium]
MQYWHNFRLGIQRLYLNDRLFMVMGVLIVLAVLAYALPWLTFLPIMGLAILMAALGFDIWQLFNGRLRLFAHRRLPKVLSLGDEMPVRIEIGNLSPIPLKLTVMDELPEQLQIRDMQIETELKPKQRKSLRYPIRPTTRGAYHFGAINVYLETALGLVQRRFIIDQDAELPVYPSIVQMKQYSQMSLSVSVPAPGMRKLRRMGKSYEFDQIKNYVRGDDYRSINWRATSRRNELMVNHYEDERAQQIYCIIDKSRQMHLPFNGLSLLDYAINATLALSNIVLKKHDRAGLITYSDKIGTALRADGKSTQLQKIIQALYREKARTGENNPELLYFATRKFISGRSLLLLFSNFESNYALERALPMLRRINANHLLVVVLFENTEIRDSLDLPAYKLSEIYHRSTARHFLYEKQMLAQRLRQYGIQVILTRPEDLTATTIGKYLELKRRGMI